MKYIVMSDDGYDYWVYYSPLVCDKFRSAKKIEYYSRGYNLKQAKDRAIQENLRFFNEEFYIVLVNKRGDMIEFARLDKVKDGKARWKWY